MEGGGGMFSGRLINFSVRLVLNKIKSNKKNINILTQEQSIQMWST